MTIHFEEQAEFHALFLDPMLFFLTWMRGRNILRVLTNQITFIEIEKLNCRRSKLFEHLCVSAANFDLRTRRCAGDCWKRRIN
jgi:hypothetical protein